MQPAVRPLSCAMSHRGRHPPADRPLAGPRACPPRRTVLHPACLGRRMKRPSCPGHQRPQVGCRDPDRRVPVRRRGRGDPQADDPEKGDSFQLTGPMGNGFDVADILSKYQKIAVVGGGIGTAPMYQLTRDWRLAASSRTSSSASAISPTAWKSTAPSRASSRYPPTPAQWVSTGSSPSCMTRRITMWCWCAAPRS